MPVVGGGLLRCSADSPVGRRSAGCQGAGFA